MTSTRSLNSAADLLLQLKGLLNTTDGNSTDLDKAYLLANALELAIPTIQIEHKASTVEMFDSTCESSDIISAGPANFVMTVECGDKTFECETALINVIAHTKGRTSELAPEIPPRGETCKPEAVEEVFGVAVDYDERINVNAEEGDICDCDNGYLQLEEVENCTCFLGHPPCGACTSVKLWCSYCGWVQTED